VTQAIQDKQPEIALEIQQSKHDLPDMVQMEESLKKAERRLEGVQKKLDGLGSLGSYISKLTAGIHSSVTEKLQKELPSYTSLDIDFIRGKRKSLSSALYDVALERGIKSEGILYLIQSLPDLESFLYSTSAGKYYRDHTEHQLRVAVLGDFLLEQDLGKGTLLTHISDLTELDKDLIKEEVWWVMGLIHDIGYPLQKMTTSINYSLLNQILKCYPMLDLDVVPFEINISSKKTKPYLKFITEGLSKEAQKLINTTTKDDLSGISIPQVQHFQSSSKGHEEFRFKSEIELDHGVVGALCLLKSLGTPEEIKENRDELEGYIKAAQAIALHNFKDHLPDYNFDNNPLAFLLVLADEMQEWGRPIPLQIRDSYFTTEMKKITLLDEVILTIDEVQWLMEYKKMEAKVLTNFQFHYFCDSKNKAFGRLQRGEEFPKTRIVLQDYEIIIESMDEKQLEQSLKDVSIQLPTESTETEKTGEVDSKRKERSKLKKLLDSKDPEVREKAKMQLQEMKKERDTSKHLRKLMKKTTKEKLLAEFYIVI
ncbi:MAG: hypothetical protein KGD59_07895, partial [Candidatus Heimdallarchaeota archaeon]|nr:hypothetical protein [Candidatus Heimdallarchaeota archaeon]